MGLRLLATCALAFVGAAAPASSPVIFVSSFDNGRVHQYDLATGSVLAVPASFNFGGGSADGMHVDALGRLHVATTDGGVSRIRRFNADFSGPTTISAVSGVTFLDQTTNGSFIYQATFSGIYRANADGSGLAPFITPSYGTDGVRIGPDGLLYVVNTGSGTIDRFDAVTGAPAGAFLGSSSFSGQASQLDFGPDGRVYVSRTIGGVGHILRYSRFNPLDPTSPLDPSSEQVFGTIGGGLATGIRFGPDGRLYANNYGAGNVWRSGTDLSITGTMSVFIPAGLGGLGGPGSVQFYPVAVPEPAAVLLVAAGGWFAARRARFLLQKPA
jgi:sugar lactone lactonase YvrE